MSCHPKRVETMNGIHFFMCSKAPSFCFGARQIFSKAQSTIVTAIMLMSVFHWFRLQKIILFHSDWRVTLESVFVCSVFLFFFFFSSTFEIRNLAKSNFRVVFDES